MSEFIFAASYMKLERVRGFIAELDAERLRYLASNPATVTMLADVVPPQIQVRWEGVGLLPGAIIGDAIHNLRTALDQMASELARINDRSDKDVYFPFAVDLETLEKSEKFKAFKKCGQDCVDELLNLKPYRGGNDALRAVHDLDNHDKHTALVPASQSLNVSVEGSYDLDDLNNHSFKAVVSDISYIFPDGTPLVGQEVIPTLEKLMETFPGILQTFADIVAART